uniref:Cuticle collagen 99 isoform X3 n=1 Tax=Geotrypetes seraphini TaxID=260995 RepID=A0A6P8QZ68_GEOSA|nr:putative cuticle collagen 99 isoform X3 [Geotrypetes seraphini]
MDQSDLSTENEGEEVGVEDVKSRIGSQGVMDQSDLSTDLSTENEGGEEVKSRIGSEGVMDQTDLSTENEGGEEVKSRGRGGRNRGGAIRGGMVKKVPVIIGRERNRDKVTNGSGRRRGSRGRMRPYPNPRGRRGSRGGPPGFPPPPHMRGMPRSPYPHLPPRPAFSLPPPPGPMGFRGRPLFARARGVPLGPRGHFLSSRGFPNGLGAPPLPPPGRGQRWPGPPGGRRY